MLNRKGEEEKVRFRTDRCFSVGNAWFIATREGQDIGPFKCRRDAERAVPRFIKIVQEQKTADIYTRKLVMEGIWASNHYA